jgi:hypothetical protein
MTACYDLHGIGVTLTSSDRDLLSAVDGRLRHFPAAEAGFTGVRFDYAVDAAPAARPEGTGRPVYEPPAGEVLYFADADTLWIDDGNGIQVLCDAGAGVSSTRVVPGRRADLWMLSRPMLTLPLLELLKRHGRFGVHAAGVDAGGRGVLVAGASGAGKSTLALALTRGGFGFLGDDLLFLRRGGDGLVALGFPDEVDVTPATALLFPELAGPFGGPPPDGWPKHRLRADEAWGARTVLESRPEIVLFPAVSGREQSSIEPLGPEEALLELAPNVLLTDPAAAQAHLDVLGDLVGQARCYRLATGRALDRVPALVRGLLDGA